MLPASHEEPFADWLRRQQQQQQQYAPAPTGLPTRDLVADAVAGDSRAVTLAARLDDSTAHFRAAARRFTRLLKRASEDEPEATKLAFRLEVVGQAVE